MTRRREFPMVPIYRWPLVLALVIALGLAAALSGEGLGRMFSWVALACPLVVIIACLMRLELSR
jgi:hypothetical protein